MNPMTIQCDRCATHLVLTAGLLERVGGRSGRVTCQGCGEKIGLDARGESLVLSGAQRMPEPDLELDEPPVLGGDQLSLLPPPPSSLPYRASLHPVPRPPRPSSGARPSVPPPASSDPFDPLGSLAPVVPLQGVRLTEDGRLVNRTDEAPAVKPRSPVRTWAPILAAALLGTGFASARAGSILPLRRAAPAAKVAASPAVEVTPAGVAVSESAALDSGERAPVAPLAAPAASPEAESALRSAPTEARRSSAASVLLNEPSQDESAPAESESAQTVLGGADDVTSQANAPTPEAEGAADVASAGDTAADEGDSPDVAEGAEFSKDAASVALQHAAAEAMSCRQPGDPAGSARVVVTFAPSGRVTSANINGAPYAGTATGGCIAGRFRGATVPAFVGGYVTVSKTISLQ